MKRAIKYWNVYESDKAGFSTSSTKYEILSGLHPDTAGHAELKAIAKGLGFKTNGVGSLSDRQGDIAITEAVRLVGKHEHEYFGRIETHNTYIGFVKLVECELLPALESTNNEPPASKDFDSVLAEIVSNGSMKYDLGIDAIGYHGQDRTQIVIMSDWKYFHVIPLLGYSLEAFEKQAGIESSYSRHFYDSVSRCSSCYEYDYNDNGYNHNFKEVNGEYLGINCGCI